MIYLLRLILGSTLGAFFMTLGLVIFFRAGRIVGREFLHVVPIMALAGLSLVLLSLGIMEWAFQRPEEPS